MHDVTHKSPKQQTNLIHDKHGDPILDPETSANHFNEFFTSLYKDLNPNDTRQTATCTKLKDFVDEKVPDGTEFEIPLVSPSFIFQQLQNLKVNKATGIDDISAKYLKLSASVISQPLATILNVSIANGIYPDDLNKKPKLHLFSKKAISMTLITIDSRLLLGFLNGISVQRFKDSKIQNLICIQSKTYRIMTETYNIHTR